MGEVYPVVMYGYAVNNNLTVLYWFQLVYTSDECTLSRSARATYNNHFSRSHMEIDIVKNVKFSKPLIYVLKVIIKRRPLMHDAWFTLYTSGTSYCQ